MKNILFTSFFLHLSCYLVFVPDFVYLAAPLGLAVYCSSCSLGYLNNVFGATFVSFVKQLKSLQCTVNSLIWDTLTKLYLTIYTAVYKSSCGLVGTNGFCYPKSLRSIMENRVLCSVTISTLAYYNPSLMLDWLSVEIA